MRLLSMAAAQQGQSVFLDVDLKIYLDSLTTPLSAPQITLLNTFVTNLKTGLGITRLYDAFDQMLIHANETIESGLNNLVKRSHDATLSATAPTFTALEGFTGNGSSAFINTNFDIINDRVTFLQNNSSFGYYTRLGTDGSASTMMGIRDGGRFTQLIPVLAPDKTLFMGHNGASTGYINFAEIGEDKGLITSNRSANNNTTIYQDKILKITDTALSQIMNPANMYLLARFRVGSTPDVYSNSQLSFTFMGKYLSPTDLGVLYDTFQAYMTANGKQV